MIRAILRCRFNTVFRREGFASPNVPQSCFRNAADMLRF
jgi:hypothetical protein